MEFSRQEYWCGLPFPYAGELSDPGMEAESPALHADSLPSEHFLGTNLLIHKLALIVCTQTSHSPCNLNNGSLSDPNSCLFVCFQILFIYLWLCWVFVSAHGFSLVPASKLLVAVASLPAEARL